ncbi:acyl-CoA dehydrogenase/oxidase [Xylaria cf. heliscus]|nr:acyl-CoA dehydrogenase/oxidase [Xylaria cf. heliscus]
MWCNFSQNFGNFIAIISALPLLEKLINFDVCGEFLLTEIGRGLDARNLETTATLQPDGSFDLHTPTPSAAKAMPPTSPLAGVGRIGVLFARLLVNGSDHGIKTFIVHLSDENGLLPGVTSQLLPERCALAKDPRMDFFRQIHRVPTGTLSLSMTNIPALQLSALIVGTYSSRRHVTAGSDGKGIPIIRFPTQYRPLLDALTIALFFDNNIDMEVRHGVAVCFKTALAELCGWPGLFAYNGIIEMALARNPADDRISGRSRSPQ